MRLLTVLPPAQRTGPLRAADLVAPHDPNTLLARAQQALAEQRIEPAVRDLVQLAEQYHPQVPQAALALGRRYLDIDVRLHYDSAELTEAA